MKLSEELRKRWALKFILWGMDLLELEDGVETWDEQRKRAYLLKHGGQFCDQKISLTHDELNAAITAVETYLS